MNVTELVPKFMNYKSFGGKAKVVEYIEDGTIVHALYSYDTLVVDFAEDLLTINFYPKWDVSRTTKKHVVEFIYQFTQLNLLDKDDAATLDAAYKMIFFEEK